MRLYNAAELRHIDMDEPPNPIKSLDHATRDSSINRGAEHAARGTLWSSPWFDRSYLQRRVKSFRTGSQLIGR